MREENVTHGSHAKLHALNAWCKATGLLYPWVSFYGDRSEWAVRIVAPVRGKARPLRTIQGADLETVCAEILPEAQRVFDQEKPALEREAKAARKRDAAARRRDMREMEAMHYTADDY